MTTKKKAATQLVLGIFRKDTTIGQLATSLQDQRPHKLSAVLNSMKGKVKNPKYRVQILTEYGRRKRAFRIEKDRKKDVIRLVLAARAKKTVKKATPAPRQTAVA